MRGPEDMEAKKEVFELTISQVQLAKQFFVFGFQPSQVICHFFHFGPSKGYEQIPGG